MTLGNISPYQLCRKYANKNNLKFNELANTRRSSHFGWKYIPEVILSPREFDYPREFEPNQIHIGPVVDMERREADFDNSFPEVIEKIERMIRETGKKLVYCAMGNYDFKHRKKRIKFYSKVLSVFMNKPALILVLSTGKDIYLKGFTSKSGNIYIFQQVPQLALLGKSSLMINHGGMQSVTECIISRVPMLVYPLDPDLDQRGNAARVDFHGIGLSGNLKRDVCGDIDRKVTRIVGNGSFRKNTIILAEKMSKNEDYRTGITMIREAFLDGNKYDFNKNGSKFIKNGNY